MSPEQKGSVCDFLSAASTWIPENLNESAWLEHAPFAFWLIETHEPRVLIELGTHLGYSFFSFCQAIVQLKLSTRAYAVDTWKGDEHAGFYDEEVFQAVSKHNAERYSSFAQLVRSTFDDALPYFEDGSVDLLHIDGRHFYEDVKHDFDLWLPKLSDRGIVLLHDTDVRERSFGVFRWWTDLSHSYPHFQFFHGWGLGVLAVGKKLPRRLRTLFETENDREQANKVRQIYARLGASLSERLGNQRLKGELRFKEVEASALKGQVSALEAQLRESSAALAARTAEHSGVKAELADVQQKAAHDRRGLEELLDDRAQLLSEAGISLENRNQRIGQLEAQLDDRAHRLSEADAALEDRGRRIRELEALLDDRAHRLSEADTALEDRGERIGKLEALLDDRTRRLSEADAALEDRGERIGKLEARLNDVLHQVVSRTAQLDDAMGALAKEKANAVQVSGELQRKLNEAEQLRHAISTSTAWRITGPVRAALSRLPPGGRRLTRRIVKAAYWAATPHRMPDRIKSLRDRTALTHDRKPVVRAAAITRKKAEAWADFFDRKWYLEHYPDVAAAALDPLNHFADQGAAQGRDPNPAFNTSWYLSQYRDVADAGLIAIDHFIEWGAAEGRRPLRDFDYDYYREQAVIPSASNLEAYRHYLENGRRSGLRASAPPTFSQIMRNRFSALEPLRVYEAPHHGPRVTIVTDSINAGSLYGGVATAIILGVLMARRLNGDLRLVTRTEPADTTNIGMILKTHGISWHGNVEFLYSPPGQGGRDIPISRDDFFLTTSWWGTHATRGAVPASRIFYMLGEDERLFYPTGDDHLLCGETLSDPEIFYAVNSRVLFEYLQANGLAPGGVPFEPAFSSTVYYPDQCPANGRQQFFFYGRPHNLRNLFWRGVSAISAAIEDEIFEPEKWDFTFLGKDMDEMVLPRGVCPRIMNDAAREDYLGVIRRADVGLSLIYTPHPSYPPFDLAACGAVVVTNRFGSKTDLSQYSPNILCVDPSLPGLVAGLRSAVAMAKDRAKRVANVSRFAMPRDWETSLAPVLDQIADRYLKR